MNGFDCVFCLLSMNTRQALFLHHRGCKAKKAFDARQDLNVLKQRKQTHTAQSQRQHSSSFSPSSIRREDCTCEFCKNKKCKQAPFFDSQKALNVHYTRCNEKLQKGIFS